MRELLAIVLSVALLVTGCSVDSDVSVEIQVEAPDDYIRGAVFELGAVYDAEGVERRADIDDRVLETSASFVLEVPAQNQGVLQAIEAELRHPKYRPASVILLVEEGASSASIMLQPQRWTTNARHTFIEPAYETTVAAAEHLDWIKEVYFNRPEWLLINEAFQEDHRLVAMLAYGGGSKKGDWERVRLANIERWEGVSALMEERSYTPCPPGYELEGFAHRPCGAERLNITYYERDDGRAAAAEQEEQLRQIVHARNDLARRLQVDVSDVKFGGYQKEDYNPARNGCPDAGDPADSSSQHGYLMVFSAGRGTSFSYYGKKGELPFFCRQKS